MKTCSKCGAVKPFEDYYIERRKSGREGYRAECKACNIAARMRYAADNRDACLAAQAAWYLRNREYHLQRVKSAQAERRKTPPAD